MPSNPKNTVSTVIPGPRVRILLPPAASQLRTGLPPLHGNPTDGEEAERTADHPSHDHLFFYSPDRKAHADGYAGFHDF
jgi:hypothetical protein